MYKNAVDLFKRLLSIGCHDLIGWEDQKDSPTEEIDDDNDDDDDVFRCSGDRKSDLGNRCLQKQHIHLRKQRKTHPSESYQHTT